MSDTALQWVAVDLLTGQVVVDLPNVEVAGDLAATIGAYEQAQVVLHVDDSINPSWLESTKPGGGALIAYTGDQASPVIAWGGIIQQRVRAPGSNAVSLGLATVEAYLDACPVGTYSATDVNQDTILAALVAFATSTNRLTTLSLTHVAPSTALQSVDYSTSSQITVYAALQALSAVQGGPEWTMGWHWDLAASTITPTLTYGSRIGAPVVAGQQPSVTVEAADLSDGSMYAEDYTPGQGANQVVAYGGASQSASSPDVPVASATAIDLKGRPLWTFTYSPNQTISDPVVLGTYAAAAVTQMNDGGQPVTMVLSITLAGKQLGVDWNIGDDIGWSLTGVVFPQSMAGISRCIGYRINQQTVTPIIKAATP